MPVTAVLVGLWIFTVPLALAILVDYRARWRPGGIMPQHVTVIATAYLLLATVGAWGSRAMWEQVCAAAGLALGIVALVIVLRREWSR